jgi:hypothetical protein
MSEEQQQQPSNWRSSLKMFLFGAQNSVNNEQQQMEQDDESSRQVHFILFYCIYSVLVTAVWETM